MAFQNSLLVSFLHFQNYTDEYVTDQSEDEWDVDGDIVKKQSRIQPNGSVLVVAFYRLTYAILNNFITRYFVEIVRPDCERECGW